MSAADDAPEQQEQRSSTAHTLHYLLYSLTFAAQHPARRVRDPTRWVKRESRGEARRGERANLMGDGHTGRAAASPRGR